MDCCVTIEQHLRGLINQFAVADETLRSILYQAGVSWGTPLTDMERENVELCEAWLYVWCLNLLPYAKNNTKDSDGGWEHTEGGYQTLDADRSRWWSYLRWLWRRWRWPWLKELLDDTSQSRIVMFNL